MQDTNIETRLHPADAELSRRIVVLEEHLLEKEKTVEALQDSEKRYRRLFESAKDGILILDAETGRVVDVNPFLMQLLGYSYHAVIGKYIWEIGVFKDIAASKEAFKVLQDNEYIRYEDLPLEAFDKRPIAVEFVSNVCLVDHRKVIQCNIRDITARNRAEAEHKRLIAAVEQVEDAIVMTDAKGIIQFVNSAFERTTGYSREEAVGQNPRILKSGQQDELFYSNLWDTISGGRTWAGRMVSKRKDGTLYTEESMVSPVRDASGQIVNYVSVKRDITEKLRLAAQSQQARKMEAVGLLAGGVAHDYNNMLGVILGYTELAMKKVEAAQPLYADLRHIFNAAKRSADITRELLAFARKETIAPVALDLNRSVESIVEMLRRLIREDIDLEWLPTVGPCPIMMDPIQVEQILMNLCLNARDAIPGVGQITIETGSAIFDEAYCADHAGFVPGKYALLAVSDSGDGMDKDTLGHIFDPFFTTKELGQGTGLGLSMVYGIVSQNNGFINVYSEQGKGTTFNIYLPSCSDKGVQSRMEKTAEIPSSCGETVLVVEDELSLLMIAKMMLEKMGYRVLIAGTPSEAIGLAEKHATEIQLLITDVVMPGMNGRDLAERLHSLYPNLKTLFASGYTANVIGHRGVLDEGVSFIQKPFSMKDLAVKVREALRDK